MARGPSGPAYHPRGPTFAFSAVSVPVMARGRPRSERSAGCQVMICLCPTSGARPERALYAFAFPALLLLLWRVACLQSELSAGSPALISLYDLPLSHFLRMARAGPLSICLSCFIAAAMARGLSSERTLRRRPSSHFPLFLNSALPALCVSVLHGRGGGGGFRLKPHIEVKFK